MNFSKAKYETILFRKSLHTFFNNFIILYKIRIIRSE